LAIERIATVRTAKRIMVRIKNGEVFGALWCAAVRERTSDRRAFLLAPGS
jgi:hypothetical protein